MVNRFEDKIVKAAREGMMRQCCESLQSCGRSAHWYSSDQTRIDAKTFDSLREDVDAAEAMWEASQANRSGER